jgi:hypothetical protein
MKVRGNLIIRLCRFCEELAKLMRHDLEQILLTPILVRRIFFYINPSIPRDYGYSSHGGADTPLI